MESSKAELTEIGRAIRAALDAEADAADHLRVARAAVIRHVTLPRANAPRALSVWSWLSSHPKSLAGALVAAAAASSVGLWIRSPISFEVGSSRSPGRLGDLIEAVTTTPIPLKFSEGSSVVLERGRLRVLSVESTGARVLLENGSAEVSIVHQRRDTKWSLEAGPFHVLVVGTKFRMAWDPNTQLVGIDMKEGAVVVSGACLEAGRTVQAGEQLNVSCVTAPPSQPAHVDTGGDTSGDDGASSMLGAPPRALGSTPLGAPSHAERTLQSDRSTAKTAPRAMASGSWRELLGAGRLLDAFRAAEHADFRSVCGSATAAELIALADGARLSGRLDRAMEALRTVRQRFAGSSEAATAAFAMGRIAFDQQAAYRDAGRWFSVYLKEQPNGPLMGDATGRLMEARDRQGDRQGARGDAERYLDRFPEGPYAHLARRILSK